MPGMVVGPSDDGTYKHLSFHGGETIPYVRLLLLFWGSAWPNPTGGRPSSEISFAAQRMLRGPYMRQLAQYGVHGGSLHGTLLIPSDPPNPVSSEDWHTKLNYLITGGQITFDPSGSSGPNLFMFILPPGVTIKSETGLAFSAEHSSVRLLFGGRAAGGIIQGFSDLDSTTFYLSHELVEACTNKVGGKFAAWTFDGVNPPENEICDFCQKTQEYVSGVWVQGYWSDIDGGCVIPLAFSLRTFMQRKGLDPSKGFAGISPPVKSVLAFIAAG